MISEYVDLSAKTISRNLTQSTGVIQEGPLKGFSCERKQHEELSLESILKEKEII